MAQLQGEACTCTPICGSTSPMRTTGSKNDGPRTRSPQRKPRNCTSFVDNGYMTVSLGLDEEFCAAMDGEITGLWQRRPKDLAVSPAFDRPMSFPDYDGPVRARGYRIPDLHSHSAHALDLYLQPTLFRMVELIFDAPALAFQSLYFEYGSSQGLHRDPMFVATHPPLNMCAAWVALEDITPDSGPLLYAPGSHRLPWYEFEAGTIACKEAVPKEKRTEFAIWLQGIMREKGLEAAPVHLQARRRLSLARRTRARRRSDQGPGAHPQELRRALHDCSRLQVTDRKAAYATERQLADCRSHHRESGGAQRCSGSREPRAARVGAGGRVGTRAALARAPISKGVRGSDTIRAAREAMDVANAPLAYDTASSRRIADALLESIGSMTQNPLPTFVIIGAQKSATRWLRINLGQHPQIFTARSELHFWNAKWKVQDHRPGELPRAVRGLEGRADRRRGNARLHDLASRTSPGRAPNGRRAARRPPDRDPAQPDRQRQLGDAASRPSGADRARPAARRSGPRASTTREGLVLPRVRRLVRQEPRAVRQALRRAAARAVARRRE